MLGFAWQQILLCVRVIRFPMNIALHYYSFRHSLNFFWHSTKLTSHEFKLLWNFFFFFLLKLLENYGMFWVNYTFLTFVEHSHESFSDTSWKEYILQRFKCHLEEVNFQEQPIGVVLWNSSMHQAQCFVVCRLLQSICKFTRVKGLLHKKSKRSSLAWGTLVYTSSLWVCLICHIEIPQTMCLHGHACIIG